MKLTRYRRCFFWIASALMLSFGVVAWLVGGSLVAPANRYVGPAPSDLPIDTLEIQSESGSILAAWHLRASDSNATVILFHPVRGDRRSMLGRAELFYQNGFSVLMIDFQAHGESSGRNITLGFLEKFDVEAAVKFVRRNDPNHRIGIVGSSLGGASTLLASPLDVDAIVLESVYPTVADAVYDRIDMRLGIAKYVLAPALLCQLRPRLGFSPSELRPIDFVDDVECAILFASGDLDRHTPMRETNAMFDAAREPKQLVMFRGAKHEDLLEYDAKMYEMDVLGFFNSYLNPHP